MTERCGFERSVVRNSQYFSLVTKPPRLHIYRHKTDKQSLLFLREPYVSTFFPLGDVLLLPLGLFLLRKYCYNVMV